MISTANWDALGRDSSTMQQGIWLEVNMGDAFYFTLYESRNHLEPCYKGAHDLTIDRDIHTDVNENIPKGPFHEQVFSIVIQILGYHIATKFYPCHDNKTFNSHALCDNHANRMNHVAYVLCFYALLPPERDSKPLPVKIEFLFNCGRIFVPIVIYGSIIPSNKCCANMLP